MGGFFKKLDKELRCKGARTYRIGFNAGDRFFSYGDNYTPFRQKPEEWRRFIEAFIERHDIDMIFLFGDCRFYQKTAREVAYRKGAEVFVFEEGYVRPHYITMERFGVNGFSTLPKSRAFYDGLPDEPLVEPRHARFSKTNMIVSATLYYAVANLFSFRYPYYRHHRDFSAIKEAWYGVRGLFRKMVYAVTERGYAERFSGELSKRYYFVPLQTHNDFQILQHSSYRSIEKFIIEVLESFAKHAPEGTFIVFKHHPVDRGRKNYRNFIEEQAELLDVAERTIVIHDVHLPTCLKHAIGTVTINSTVGLSSVGHGIPTIVRGQAIYDIEGLTNKGVPLEEFWHTPKPPDTCLYRKFRNYVIKATQLNGSFYGRFPDTLRCRVSE
jgi:capsular polysaccharide export protein